ncbi:MAG: GreA/GreB family elongation factor [Phycisphaerales bacterium]|nr:MAG: GreA/GreB family elongation factor [Phycisphaerales bacterium]
MATDVENMLKLVASGGYGKVEEEWSAAIEDADTELSGLVPVLRALVKAGQTESAELLAWSTVSPARDRLEPEECLALIKEMFIAVPEGDDLRDELITQYKTVHADVANIDQLIQACGLEDGSRMPRLALRTLELSIHVKEGAFLLSRQDDSPARVTEVSEDCSAYKVQVNQFTREYEAAALAREFRPAERDDFRVLTQWDTERLKELLEKDPAALTVSILRSRGGSYSVDDVKFTLCPRYLPPESWGKWWTKARAGLKKHHAVRLEGRSPVMLVYDPSGWTIEEVSWENFPKSEATADYHDAAEGYLREVRARNLKPEPKHLNRMAEAIASRLKRSAKHMPDRGLGMTLVLESLLRHGAKMTREAPTSAAELLGATDKPADMLSRLTDGRLWTAALRAAREGYAETWTEVFARLLPRTPMQACERIAKELVEAGHREKLNECIAAVMNEPAMCMDAIAWMWKGSEHLQGVAMPTRLEILTTMLNTLGSLQRDGGDQEQLKRVRGAVKAALSGAKSRGFAECLDTIDQGMAAALRNQIQRLDGLGVVLVESLVEEIRKRFPQLWARKKEVAWKDQSVIYCTEAGMSKLEEEIDHVVNVEMPANAKAIGQAAAHGDLSDNAEYQSALDARDMLRARLAKLQHQLSIARIISPDEIPRDHAGIGTRVTVQRASEGQRRTMTFLGPWEAEVDKGIFNYQAPMAQQVMGRAVGESVVLKLDDTEAEWTVERIEPGIEAPSRTDKFSPPPAADPD